MLPSGMPVARSHGEKEALRHRLLRGVTVFRIQFWTAVLLLLGSAGGGMSAEAVSMRCRIGEQAWSPCRMVAASPGERWALTWDQQRVEFVHDGSGQMMMRVAQGEDWLRVQPSWTVDRSLCWGAVCATGAIPLD